MTTINENIISKYRLKFVSGIIYFTVNKKYFIINIESIRAVKMIG